MVSATLQLHPAPVLFDSLSRLHSPRRFLNLPRRSSSSFTSTFPAATVTSPGNRISDVKLSSFPNTNSHRPWSSSAWITNWSNRGFRPFPKRPRAVVDYRHGLSSDDDELGTSRSAGSSTMAKIVEKLKKYGYIEDSGERDGRALPEKGSVEDIFYAEDGILPDPKGGLSLDLSEGKIRFPWEKHQEGEGKEEGEFESGRKKPTKSSLAELTLPQGELQRLRHLAFRIKSKTKIGGRGVTKEVVDLIHEKWRTEEVVRIKCEGPPALNMKRTHEILEQCRCLGSFMANLSQMTSERYADWNLPINTQRKTGGLVIWRSGSSISLYRGVTYEVPQLVKRQYQTSDMNFSNKSPTDALVSTKEAISSFPDEVDKEKDTESPPEIKYEVEIDKLLDDLGPRYTDWPGSKPLPVDADLLPGIASGYKPPFRILPFGVRPYLGPKDSTALRRLARVLPPHFALGRSRQHEGLAMAMVKLWEHSSIAKIALKRGVQLTTIERMAEIIKRLTGGTILSRNKDYIVFYRGKDFLAREVAEALLEKERLAKSLQDEEEQARIKASSLVSFIESSEQPAIAGSLGETLEANARWGNTLDDDHSVKMFKAAEVARHADLVRKLERKLFLAERKMMKAGKALAKVEESLKPTESTSNLETLTDEERYMFRKLGLRMKAYLLLGRRGVFDGTVENMHLHWKYRELVKIIIKAKTFAQVKNVALSLEAESGGILVSVDKISKGFAIIVYRGKDYQRPPTIRPKNLLTKRKALARSIELQRREALNKHISNLQKRVDQLRSELVLMDNVKTKGDEELYTKLSSAYSTEDEDTEDEDEEDESYLDNLVENVNSDTDEDGEAYSYDESDDCTEDFMSEEDNEVDSNVGTHSFSKVN